MKITSRAVLAIAVMGTLGGWLATVAHWSDLATPQAISGLFILMASTLSGAFGVHTDPSAVIESKTTTSPDGHVIETKKITNTGDLAVPVIVSTPDNKP